MFGIGPGGAPAPAPRGPIPNAIAENSFAGGAGWRAGALLYCEGEAPNSSFSRLRLMITTPDQDITVDSKSSFRVGF